MSEPSIAIEVSSVAKRFGSVVALDSVSFSVKKGEMFFLLGPSGCGKTTLLRILAGLETPDSGTIKFDGKDVMSLPPHPRGAPMVFQNYALWPHLNVKDNIAFGLVERRVSKDEIGTRVTEALRLVDLAGMAERLPNQLSGGQQQRVVLARALVLNPGIVLLDEPLSNLDAKLRIEMRDEIAKLHAGTDITFVYVTHDQTEALSLADRMAVLSAGKVMAVGTPRDLYHRPPNLFCADFLGKANIIKGKVASVDEELVVVETSLGELKGIAISGHRLLSGAAVTCLIRPENLGFVAPSPLPSPSRGEGEVAALPGPKKETGKRTSSPLTGEDRGEGDATLQSENRFDATVRSVRMNGATLTVELDANGIPLKATLLNRSSFSLSVGQKTRWSVAAEDIVVIA